MLSSKANQQKQIKDTFAAIKTGKFNKILDVINQYGVAVLALSNSANSDKFGTMVVKKGLFYKILKQLIDTKKIDDDVACQLIKTYLPVNAPPNLKAAIDKERQLIANDAALEPIFLEVMVDQVSENMEPLTKNLIFDGVRLGDVNNTALRLRNFPHYIHATDSSGNLAHAAAESYNPAIIQTLKSFGVDLNYLHERKPPILSALRCGNLPAVEIFIAQGANLNLEIELISNFLFTFSLAECALYFMLLLNKDEWPTYLPAFRLILKQNLRMDIPRVLFILIFDNVINAIKNSRYFRELIGRDIDLSKIIVAEPKSNLSLIQIAAKYKRYAILEILIEEFKLSVDLTYQDTPTALCIVLSHDAVDMVGYLLKQNPNLLKVVNGMPFLHLVLQSMPKQMTDFLKMLVTSNYLEHQRLLNMPGPIFQQPKPNQNNQTKNHTPIQIAILAGNEDLIEFLLSLDFIEKQLQPSLINLVLLQHDIVTANRLILLLKRFNVLPQLTDIGDVSFFPNEKKKLFCEHFPWQEPAETILTASTKAFVQHIQRAWIYHRLTKIYDASLAKKTDAFIRHNLTLFYEKHKTDFDILDELMWLFRQINQTQELQMMRQMFFVFYNELSSDDEMKQVLLEQHQAIVRNILESIFKDLNDLPKETSQENSSAQEAEAPVIKPLSNELPYYCFSIPEKIMTGYAFTKEYFNGDSAAMKQFLAESKSSSAHGQYPGRLFSVKKKSTKSQGPASWLAGKLTEDDSRVIRLENKENYFIFISDEVRFLGPESQRLMGKSRWKIGPTNAVKKLKAPQAFTLNLNQESMPMFFGYEICAKSTADRILCGVLRDEAGNRLILPCYYQENGLHADNQPLVNVISMEIRLKVLSQNFN